MCTGDASCISNAIGDASSTTNARGDDRCISNDGLNHGSRWISNGRGSHGYITIMPRMRRVPRQWWSVSWNVLALRL